MRVTNNYNKIGDKYLCELIIHSRNQRLANEMFNIDSYSDVLVSCGVHHLD